MPFDQIMNFFRACQTMDVEPNDFINAVMKHKVKSKVIRKYEHKYSAVKKNGPSKKPS